MNPKISAYWKKSFNDWNFIFFSELRNVVRDKGLIIFFLFLPLAYPLVYSFIYTNEVVRDVPVVAVDESRTTVSRDYLRRLDATSDVRIVTYAASMEEARRLLMERKAYGIVFLPRAFKTQVLRGEPTQVEVFSDMSSLLYYKSVLSANTDVMLSMNAEIKVARSGNTTDRQDRLTEHPIRYESVSLFNPQNGFAAFLIPAVLILILQQSLLLGIGLSTATAREKNSFTQFVPLNRHYVGLLRIVLGRGAVCLLVYLANALYVLVVVPWIFGLNQIGNPFDIFLFIVPFLIACIFFSMTVAAVIRERENVMIIVVFTSVLLLFISGVSWPAAALPAFWKALSYVFPSTFGINGFIKLNTMGAQLIDVRHEWDLLWVQSAVYFLTACVAYRYQIFSSRLRRVWQRKRTVEAEAL